MPSKPHSAALSELLGMLSLGVGPDPCPTGEQVTPVQGLSAAEFGWFAFREFQSLQWGQIIL